MESIVRDIVIGAFGSILGALIVFFASYRHGSKKERLKNSVQFDEKERERWKTMHIGIRQGITNEYIFSALWHLFIANMMWVGSEALSPLIGKASQSEGVYYLLNSTGLFLCLLFFFLGLGQIIRYMRLRALDSEEDLDLLIKKLINSKSSNKANPADAKSRTTD